MVELSDSIKIIMLQDAGFHPIPLQEKYLKLVDFVKWCEDQAHAYDIPEKAEKLLKDIGEL